MPCVKCNGDIPAGSAFCNLCGTPQAPLASVAPQPASSPASRRATAVAPEAEVWSGRYSARAKGLTFVASGIWFVAVWVGFFYYTRESRFLHGVSWALTASAVVAVLPALITAVTALWRMWTLRYRLTSERLFIIRGLIARSIEELELIRVEDIATRQNVVQRIFDVGNIAVISTDSRTPRLEIEGIYSPITVKEKIRAVVQERRRRVINFESV